MNRKKFQKLLQWYFEHDFIYPGFIQEIYRNNKRSLFHDCDVSSLVKEHYQEILSKCNSTYRSLLVAKLYEREEMREFINNNIFSLLSLVEDSYDFLGFNSYSNLNLKKFINYNFSELIGKIPNVCFYSISIMDDYVEDQNKKLLNQFLTEHKLEYVTFLLGSKLDSKYSSDFNSTMDVITLLIDEVLKHEGLNYIDIKRLPSGDFSDVIEIGSKVVKVGKERMNYDIPNNEYLLKPYIRLNLEEISNLNGTVEVVEKVDTNVLDVDLYSFYKKLRSKGIVWLDIKYSNLGRLLKDNIFHYHKQLGEDMSTRGLIGDSNFTPLSKGNPVILDSDHLYHEKEFHRLQQSRDFNLSIFPGFSFEQRYQNELSCMLTDHETSVVDDKRMK